MHYVRITFDWIFGIRLGKKCERLPNGKGEIIHELEKAIEALHQDVDLVNDEKSIMFGKMYDGEEKVLGERDEDRFIKSMGIKVILTHASKRESEKSQAM